MANRTEMTQYQAAVKKRLRLSTVIIVVLIPALIALSIFLSSKKWYMPLSILILILTMAPFFMVFEKRKPKAREVVLIAMMCALTVVAQLFFHIAFPVQIGTALIIIAGVSLGPEAGFLIGAMSRFVINFYMGQGMWTPWQMFCWGLLGFLAGLAFSREDLSATKEGPKPLRVTSFMAPVLAVIFSEILGYTIYLFVGDGGGFSGYRVYLFGAIGLVLGVLLQRSKLPANPISLAIFTFITTFVIYGGIMNLAAMFTASGSGTETRMSLETLKALYISGVPYDFMHALTASICTLLFGDSIIKKLERVKIKYGIYK